VKLSDLGEFGLIERLAPFLSPYPADEDLVVGIGDDAAVWRVGGEYVIATTDTMVAGVHFVPGQAPWWDVGWKALAVNVSDIAAMGGRPTFALVTLAAPDDMDVTAIEALYEGIQACARISGTTIAGGDTVRAGEMHVSVALFGRAEDEGGEPLILRRDAAQSGDVIAVTGPLGNSAAGLLRLRDGVGPEDTLAGAHLRPRPQLAAGIAAVEAGLRCAIDVSDGLLQDLGHVCRASGVGAVVRATDVPLSTELLAAYPDDALRLACTGGEDYELLLIGPGPRVKDAIQASETPGVVIGEIVDGQNHSAMVVDDAGKPIRFARGGWDAFKS
jgi:thiamine-monophosphate kinase